MRYLVAIVAVLVAVAAADGPPGDPRATRAPELVDVRAVDPTIATDVRYATTRNLTGRRLYDPKTVRVLLERPAAEALARVHRALAADGYGLVVFDAYRPWRVTKALWDATAPAQHGYVADPAIGSRHNRGAAVDVTLRDLASGRELEMPSDYDDTSERAHPAGDGASAGARANRDRRRGAMEREGFFVHPAEWWHFDWKDWREYPVLDLPFDAVPPAPSAPPPLDLARAGVVDLTHVFDARTLYWPSAPSGFELRTLAHGPTPAGFFYAANAFCAPEHGGTHLDAPIHFSATGWTADAVPVERLVRPAVVIDVTDAVMADRDHRLTTREIAAFERRWGAIPPGSIVLLRTGWNARWPDRARVFGD